jgi:hypothetical protein
MPLRKPTHPAFNTLNNPHPAHCTLQVGGALGLAAAAYFLRGSSDAKPLHYVGGASVGAAAGIFLHMLTRPQDAKSVNKMPHELFN